MTTLTRDQHYMHFLYCLIHAQSNCLITHYLEVLKSNYRRDFRGEELPFHLSIQAFAYDRRHANGPYTQRSIQQCACSLCCSMRQTHLTFDSLTYASLPNIYQW